MHDQNVTGGVEPLAVLGGPRAVTIAEPHFRWPLIDDSDRAAVLRLLDRGEISYYRLNGVVRQFEEAFARLVELPFAVSTHSGTGAIHAGWFALDLPPGSEVIVPAYTHIGTVLPLLHLGLVPVLCDIDPRSGNIDPDALRAAIAKPTSAIGVTHQYGMSCEMEAIMEVARRHGLRVLEDCSHAHGARWRNRPVGTWGDVACFSLQAHKAVPVGEGGVLVTRDPRIAERASLLGHFREERSFTSEPLRPLVETGYGFKSRLHPLAAALGLGALQRLEKVCSARRANYGELVANLASVPGVSPLAEPVDGHRGGFFRFVVRFDPDAFAGLSADLLVRAVQAEGAVEMRSGTVARPLHTYRIFQERDVSLYAKCWRQGSDPLCQRPVYRPGDFPAAERFSAETLQMPAFTESAGPLIRQYVGALRKVQAQSELVRKVVS